MSFTCVNRKHDNQMKIAQPVISTTKCSRWKALRKAWMVNWDKNRSLHTPFYLLSRFSMLVTLLGLSYLVFGPAYDYLGCKYQVDPLSKTSYYVNSTGLSVRNELFLLCTHGYFNDNYVATNAIFTLSMLGMLTCTIFCVILVLSILIIGVIAVLRMLLMLRLLTKIARRSPLNDEEKVTVFMGLIATCLAMFCFLLIINSYYSVEIATMYDTYACKHGDYLFKSTLLKSNPKFNITWMDICSNPGQQYPDINDINTNHVIQTLCLIILLSLSIPMSACSIYIITRPVFRQIMGTYRSYRKLTHKIS